VELLDRTLRSLSAQVEARQTVTVVLGMEEREPGTRSKADALLAKFKGEFHSMIAAYHPAGLQGEVPGKAVNESWAVRCGRQELVDRMGVSIDQVIVTVVDADSILHPGYLAELARRFEGDSRRHSLFWQAPILLDNDIWRTSAAIRLVTFFSNAISAGDYFNALEARFPYSTYSLSLKLLEEVNYWDPTVMAEDVNIYMRAFFKKDGQAFVEHIHLPVHGNPIHGADPWQAVRIFYSQKVRQGWGGTEIGYMLQKWNSTPRVPFFYKLGRLLKLIHDHLFFSTAGFVVGLGTALSIMIDHSAVITLPPASFSPSLFTTLNVLGGSALLAIWFTEHTRLSRDRSNWSFRTLASEIISWVVFPWLFFLLMNLPGLQAQTQMLLGQPISYARTPKGFNAKFGD
jgi:cellulose synthase/poly-beta-1,6-N-acetylglucosamine synthase-like glycosyltransferase